MLGFSETGFSVTEYILCVADRDLPAHACSLGLLHQKDILEVDVMALFIPH